MPFSYRSLDKASLDKGQALESDMSLWCCHCLALT